MTLSEILSNEELRRHEFPVCREKIFLAHAGVCPLPRRVADAISSYANKVTLDDQEVDLALPVHQTRDLAARLLGAQADEIALVGPTALAMSFVANGLEFKKGNNVLVYFDDYPSNVYPWMGLAARGVEVRFLNIRELGRIRPVDILGQADEQTRMVALASCHFIAGWRIDLDAIGRALHERNIFFCVDAIQTMGAFPTPVAQVDFLAGDSHKWLLGPCGAGLMYVRKSLQPILRPSSWGWNNILCPNYVAQEQMVFRKDARRYEAGTHNIVGLMGLRAGLELLLEIGIDNIAAELRRKREWFVPALEAKGYVVLHAAAPAENTGGIISAQHDGADLAAIHQKLADSNIVASLRADRAGRKYLRFSPHFYNTDAELNRVLELL
jgi:selenocysteine lyase/cysteine desulfurase